MFRIALLFCLMLPCLALAVGEDDSLALEKVLRNLTTKERL